MNSYIKRLVIVISLILTYLVFLSQSGIDTFTDDFEDDKTHTNAVYENYNILKGDMNILEHFSDCPDSTAFFVANRQKPVVAKYNVYNASTITVNFYSSFGSFSTKNRVSFPLYYLGYTSLSDNTTTHPVYIYNRRLYTVTPDGTVYTGFDDFYENGLNYFKEESISPSVSDLKNQLGINISVADSNNHLQFIDTSLDDVKYIPSAGLYYHTVTAEIPSGTEFITVSMWDIDQIFDENNNVISHKQNFFSALAGVEIQGNNLEFSKSIPREVSGETLPYTKSEMSSSTNSSQSNSRTNEVSLSEENSSVADSSTVSFPINIPYEFDSEFDNNYSSIESVSEPTYAIRQAPNSEYNNNMGKASQFGTESGGNTAGNLNWGGTNVLQHIPVPSSSETDSSKDESSSEISSTQSSSVASNSSQMSEVQTSQKSSNKAIVPTIIISSFCIISTQIILYILKKPQK